jgi:hypothetical protein
MNPFRQAPLALKADKEDFERRFVAGAQEPPEAPRCTSHEFLIVSRIASPRSGAH